MKEIIQISNPHEMIELWKKYANHKKILLYWDLWVWKTVFVKWFCSYYWIDLNFVQSPTYTYVNIYKDILHIDMYRLEKFDDLIDKWIYDLINNYNLICIERPKWEEYYGRDFIKVYITKDWEKRIVEIIN